MRKRKGSPDDVMTLLDVIVWECSAFVIHWLCSLVGFPFYVARHRLELAPGDVIV